MEDRQCHRAGRLVPHGVTLTHMERQALPGDKGAGTEGAAKGQRPLVTSQMTDVGTVPHKGARTQCAAVGMLPGVGPLMALHVAFKVERSLTETALVRALVGVHHCMPRQAGPAVAGELTAGTLNTPSPWSQVGVCESWRRTTL